jgi:hypothetical protein
MRVRNEQREIERLVFEFGEQRLSQQAQSGAGIEDDNVITNPDFHASGIATVTHGTAARCGNGAANAPELYGGATIDATTLTYPPAKIKFKNAGRFQCGLAADVLESSPRSEGSSGLLRFQLKTTAGELPA